MKHLIINIYWSSNFKRWNCPKILNDTFSSGDQEASFTKDDMQQGKHQEYERKLHEQLQNQSRDTWVLNIDMIFHNLMYYLW